MEHMYGNLIQVVWGMWLFVGEIMVDSGVLFPSQYPYKEHMNKIYIF